MNPKALRLVQMIHQILLQVLEKSTSLQISDKNEDKNQLIAEPDLNAIQLGFMNLKSFLDSETLDKELDEQLDKQLFEVRKIAELDRHLKTSLNLSQIHHLMIPIERFLNKSLRDDQWLVTQVDRTTTSKTSLAPLIFVLHNIRSSFNVGSIFRLADSVGCEKIYLVGYTATPETDKQLVKTSLGSHHSVKWEHSSDIHEVLISLKDSGYLTTALETSPRSKDLYQQEWPQKIALLVGNERFGIDSVILDECDQVVHIPQYGIKNSLNVAQALSISAFEYRRQYNLKIGSKKI